MTRQSRGTLGAASAFVAVVGIASGNTYWVLFGVIALIVIGLVELWWRWGGVGLEYRRILGAESATCGDTVECVIEVTNRKVLPMPWVDVVDDWPSALVPDRVRARTRRFVVEASPDEPSGRNLGIDTNEGRGAPPDDVAQQTDREGIAQRLTLAPFERVRRHYRLPCRRRGAYTFGPVAMRWRDAFGLTSRDAELNLRSAFVVYPRIVPVIAPPAAARQLLGDHVRTRALLTDPTRLAGVRPFVSGDSVRRVHWGASARTGVLQVRRDDPTAGRRVWIVIDVETAPEDRWWSAGDTDVHETLAMVAASFAAWALQSGTAVGISANGRTAGSAADLWVPCANNPKQLARILDALARLRPWPSRPLQDAAFATGVNWPPDATVALVSAMPTEVKRRAIARAARYSQPVVTVDCRPRPEVAGTDGQSSYGVVTASRPSWRLANADESWTSRTEVRLL